MVKYRVSTKTVMVIALMAVLCMVGGLVAPGAHADEGGVSFWLPGQNGSLAAVPSDPGWSMAAVIYLALTGQVPAAVGVALWCAIVVGMADNVLRPQLVGKSLNLSSFVILLSLTFWGMTWGIAGMILCVPIMVCIAIVCTHIDVLNWIVVLLSSDGETTMYPQEA